MVGIIVRVRSVSLLLERGGVVLAGPKCAGEEEERVCGVRCVMVVEVVTGVR